MNDSEINKIEQDLLKMTDRPLTIPVNVQDDIKAYFEQLRQRTKLQEMMTK